MSSTGASQTSRITGRRQAIGLRWMTWFAGLNAAVAILLQGPVGMWAGTTAVVAVIAAPIARILWLIGRWWHERDLRFVVAGAALFGVVCLGAVLAWFTTS